MYGFEQSLFDIEQFTKTIYFHLQLSLSVRVRTFTVRKRTTQNNTKTHKHLTTSDLIIWHKVIY